MSEPNLPAVTPYLLLDEDRVRRNVERLRERLARLAVTQRPHVKTAKSLDVAGLLFPDGPGPITVSTLREAEVFAAAGYRDILYAVGIAPSKLDSVIALRNAGVDLVVLLDSVAQARAVAEAASRSGVRIPALIELDCDGHRSGLRVDDPTILEVARILESGTAAVRGVLVHAGESYFAYSPEELAAAAENERAVAVTGAKVLRAAGFAAPTVSVGSTPTAHAATNLDGVTEVRAGNYVFFDLVMAGIGVCQVDDIAISVVTTVIGHQPAKGWIMTDGGWMATSKDRGTSGQPVDQAYGLVADLDGVLIQDLLMVGASQEHGVLAMRSPGTPLPHIPVGTRLRVLPIHACATAAQHDRYHVLRTNGDHAVWPRISGW